MRRALARFLHRAAIALDSSLADFWRRRCLDEISQHGYTRRQLFTVMDERNRLCRTLNQERALRKALETAVKMATDASTNARGN